jgi:hypothetical protein
MVKRIFDKTDFRIKIVTRHVNLCDVITVERKRIVSVFGIKIFIYWTTMCEMYGYDDWEDYTAKDINAATTYIYKNIKDMNKAALRNISKTVEYKYI